MGNESTKIILKNISKSYKKGKQSITVLNDVTVTFEVGKLYAIMGASGSGKTTLFNIIGLLDSNYTGSYTLFGNEVEHCNDKILSNLRMSNIGFVFQDFLLDPNLKAYENVMMPLYINRNISASNRKKIAYNMLKQLNLENRIDHFPNELSGGEQQRVSISRALINDPTLILADEPTGNLDETMQKEIFKLLKELSKKNKCVIVVSHTSEIKKYADVIYNLSNGILKVDK